MDEDGDDDGDGVYGEEDDDGDGECRSEGGYDDGECDGELKQSGMLFRKKILRGLRNQKNFFLNSIP
ncbi:MAG: hypothetical protein HY981_04160 [Candidatus Magasanikbacteria bacterium]|nr:hypothetical protein [Candidatus Magasanikbacteria bacterium]